MQQQCILYLTTHKQRTRAAKQHHRIALVHHKLVKQHSVKAKYKHLGQAVFADRLTKQPAAGNTSAAGFLKLFFSLSYTIYIHTLYTVSDDTFCILHILHTLYFYQSIEYFCTHSMYNMLMENWKCHV